MLELEALLNPEQLAACTHTGTPLLILAGAGSGKTRVITHRIVHLMAACGAAPEHILAVTFTNKAAAEMRERVEHLLGAAGLDRLDAPPDIGTFHAICARMLRRYGGRIGLSSTFSIYDDADQIAMVQEAARALYLPADRRAARELHEAIQAFKNDGVPPDLAHERAVNAEMETRAELYTLYDQRMRAANAVDFGDLILLVNTLLETDTALRRRLQDRWRHVLVDEFQDTNPVQYRFLRLLSDDGGAPLTVVGDDDQSIYRWRGADPRNLLTFTRDYPDARLVKLEQNYRSTQPILDAASDLIAHNQARLDKRLWTEQRGGAPVRVYAARDEREEARFVSRRIRQYCLDEGHAFDAVAVFYRVNAQSRVLEEQLRADDVPYRIIGSTAFYARAEVKDLLAYLTVLVNPADDLALKRIINTPSRGIGARTLEGLEALLIAERAAPLRAPGAAAAPATGITPLGGRLFVPSPDESAPDAEARASAADTGLAAPEHRARWSLCDLLEAIRRGEVVPPGRTAPAVLELAELLNELREMVAAHAAPSRVLDAVIERTDYLAWLDQHSGDRAGETREHVAELLGSVLDFEHAYRDATLDEYLQRVSLGPVAERRDDASAVQPEGAVNLMTIHGAKGLEFDLVFVCGLEDELLPYRRRDEQPDIEEERRLCYVAFTRARRELYLSLAQYRRLHGVEKRAQPSRFLAELDAATIEWLGRGADPKSLLAPPTPQRRTPHPAFNAPRGALDDSGGAVFLPDYESESQVVAFGRATPHGQRREEVADDAQGGDGEWVVELDPDYAAAPPSPPSPGRASWRQASEPAAEGDGALEVGAAVTHRRFGIGEVLELEARNDGTMATVAFQGGVKTIFARFLRPL